MLCLGVYLDHIYYVYIHITSTHRVDRVDDIYVYIQMTSTHRAHDLCRV